MTRTPNTIQITLEDGWELYFDPEPEPEQDVEEILTEENYVVIDIQTCEPGCIFEPY